jgi:hypothetical protein
MAHAEQIEFCLQVKQRFPEYFTASMVLDVGSLDVNGNNRYLFSACHYIGIDLGIGPNVDVVKPVHEYKPGVLFDVVISTEMIEHDQHLDKSLPAMFALLRPGGLMIVTGAYTGRSEHGTELRSPGDSPFTNSYYRIVPLYMLRRYLPTDGFSDWEISIKNHDIRFWGIKR